MGRSRGGYECPMCSYAASCPKKLVRHCLEEIDDLQKFTCSRCGVSKILKYRAMLQNSEHRCYKHSKDFEVIRKVTSIADLKTLLGLGPKIEPSVVDCVIREIGWSSPADPTLKGPMKKRRVLRVTHGDEENHHNVQSVVIKPKQDMPRLREVGNVMPIQAQVHHPCSIPPVLGLFRWAGGITRHHPG